MKNQYRQGDIFLQEIFELPELDTEHYQSVEGEIIDDLIILAHGEATGHKHAIKDKNAILVKDKNSNNFFLMIINNPVALNHEEHSTIILPVGNYKVIRQREYSPEAIKYVAD